MTLLPHLAMCQSAQPPIDVDQNFQFKHFDDLVVTRHFTRSDCTKVNDTLYSHQLDEMGRKIAERRYQMGNSINGTTYFHYNTKGQLVSSKYYYQSNRGNTTGLDQVVEEKTYYNAFDSISKIETRLCNRVLKTEVQAAEQQHMAEAQTVEQLWQWLPQSFDDYTDDWTCQPVQWRTFTYDDRQHKTTSQLADERGVSVTWAYEHDDKGRLIKMIFCNREGIPFGDPDVQCQMENHLYYSYNRNTVTEVDSHYIWRNCVVTTTQTTRNKLGNIQQIVVTTERFDLNKDWYLDQRSITTKTHHYDQNDRLMDISEHWDSWEKEAEEETPRLFQFSTMYRYHYGK